MKASKITSTAAALFLAASLPVYGQRNDKDGRDDRPQQARPAQPSRQQPQAQQSRPQPQAQQSRPQPAPRQQARGSQFERGPGMNARAQPQRSVKQAQAWQQDRGWMKQGGGWQAHTTFQQGRSQNWASDHRDWNQRGGYGGAYIPYASFGMYFGTSHSFHIGARPVMYRGYPRFAYGGYSFMLLDPWPSSWRSDWYASDDVYIDYSDGYYLHNRRYPGVSLAITVVL